MNQPPVLSKLRDARVDGDHLTLLAVFHFVLAALGLFGVAVMLFESFFMGTIASNPDFFKSSPGRPSPPLEFFDFFSMFQWFFLFLAVWMVSRIFLNLFSGFCLMRRRGRMFSLVVAGLDCLQIPFGTALGVCTLIVLMRPSVQELYQNNSATPK
jgi:hypothetical protein